MIGIVPVAPPPLAPKTPPQSTCTLDGAPAHFGAPVYSYSTVCTHAPSPIQALSAVTLGGQACIPDAAAHSPRATPARFAVGMDGATLPQTDCVRQHLTDLRSSSCSCGEPRSVFVSPPVAGPGGSSGFGRPSRCSSGCRSWGPESDTGARGSHEMLGPELTLRPSHNSKQLQQVQDWREEGREPHGPVFEAFASYGTSSDCRVSGPSESSQARVYMCLLKRYSSRQQCMQLDATLLLTANWSSSVS